MKQLLDQTFANKVQVEKLIGVVGQLIKHIDDRIHIIESADPDREIYTVARHRSALDSVAQRVGSLERDMGRLIQQVSPMQDDVDELDQ